MYYIYLYVKNETYPFPLGNVKIKILNKEYFKTKIIIICVFLKFKCFYYLFIISIKKQTVIALAII